MTCKLCGYGIVKVEFWKVGIWLAQQAGYCGTGCESVAERLKEIEAMRGRAA